jgi:SAM-dependent methyltransferase
MSRALVAVHASVYDFVTRVLGRDEVEDRRVLEVGALDVNGSVRPYVTSLRPKTYIGTDRRAGRRVDLVLTAYRLVEQFGCNAFDVVLCLETLEHIADWRIALWSMFQVLREDGLLVLTTRSRGFPRHDHPTDYWRFGLAGWALLSPYCDVLVRQLDPEAPGIFLCLRKRLPIPLSALDEIHATRAPQPAS